MNRKCFFALMLLWLISMVSGCFNKQGNAAFEPQETVFTNGAFSLALPCELSNQVIVNPSESFYITDQTVFSVFHADTFAAENLGWIFSICRYTESEYCEEYLQSESRQYVFARDEWGYYCVLFPSDVQSLDPTVWKTSAKMNWTASWMILFPEMLLKNTVRNPWGLTKKSNRTRKKNQIRL